MAASVDQGRHWPSTACPTAYKGRGPAARFDGISGSGHCYSFVHTGMCTYDPRGPARTRVLIQRPVAAALLPDRRCRERLPCGRSRLPGAQPTLGGVRGAWLRHPRRDVELAGGAVRRARRRVAAVRVLPGLARWGGETPAGLANSGARAEAAAAGGRGTGRAGRAGARPGGLRVLVGARLRGARAAAPRVVPVTHPPSGPSIQGGRRGDGGPAPRYTT